MARGFNKQLDLVKEMEDIEREIVAHNIEVERLKNNLFELLVVKEDIEMREVIDYAIEAGVTSEELMRFVVNAARKKGNTKGVSQ